MKQKSAKPLAEEEYFEDNQAVMLSSLQLAAASKCAQFLNNPTVHVYYALKEKIENSQKEWLEEFLDHQGLTSLVDTVEALSNSGGHGFNSFSDAIIMVDCISCIRSLLNTNTGMKYLISQEQYTRKLVSGLDTQNILAKKHLFEILTAECVFSAEGHARVIDAFSDLKNQKLLESRFTAIITELDEADTSAYRTTMLSFINALITGAADAKERNKIRNELIGLHLLNVLRVVRKDDQDPALAIQLQIFTEQKHRDETELKALCGVDVNSHQDLFYHLFHKVLGTPESFKMLEILQDLVFMNQMVTDTQRNSMWEAVGKSLHTVCAFKTADEVNSFLERMDFLAPLEELAGKSSRSGSHSSLSKTKEVPAPDNKIIAGAPGIQTMERTDSGISACSAGSDKMGYNLRSRSQRQLSDADIAVHKTDSDPKKPTDQSDSIKVQPMPSGCTPAPSQPLQSFKWIKVNADSVRREVSLWALSDPGRNAALCRILDFKKLEEQFHDTNVILTADDEINLLSSDQSLAINLFLSRVDESVEELVDYIREANLMMLGPSTVKYLHSVLPSDAEIRQLKLYQGDKFDLGQAEQFLLALSDVPGYRHLIDSLLFKAEFQNKSPYLKSSFETLIKASKDVLHSLGLRSFLTIVLHAGNFVNHGKPFGNAGGFKLNSILRMLEVKGRDPGTDLLSHIVNMIATHDKSMLGFATDLKSLEKASGLCLEQLKSQVTELNNQLRNLLEKLASAPQSVQKTFNPFVEEVKKDLQELQNRISTLRSLTQQLALYFCEDYNSFNLRLCIQEILKLCLAIRRAQKDMAALDNQKEVAEERREELNNQCIEQHAARIFGNRADACSSFIYAHGEKVVDNLLQDLHSGQVRAGMGADEEEEDTLLISHIAANTPGKDLSALTIRQPNSVSRRVIYPDRVDNFIGPQYRRGNQMETASFLNPDNKPSSEVDLFSPELFSVKVHSKIPSGHRRTNSDLNDTRNPNVKWHRYDQNKANAKKVEKVESQKTLASLSLEMQPRVLKSQDSGQLSRQNSDQDKICANGGDNSDSKDGKKKRKSLEFFRRIGRAVLGNRSSQYNIENNNDKMFKRATKKRSSKRQESGSSDEKENDSFYDNVSPRQKAKEKVIAIKVYPSYKV